MNDASGDYDARFGLYDQQRTRVMGKPEYKVDQLEERYTAYRLPGGKPVDEPFILLKFSDPIAHMAISAWADSMNQAGFPGVANDVRRMLVFRKADERECHCPEYPSPHERHGVAVLEDSPSKEPPPWRDPGSYETATGFHRSASDEADHARRAVRPPCAHPRIAEGWGGPPRCLNCGAVFEDSP